MCNYKHSEKRTKRENYKQSTNCGRGALVIVTCPGTSKVTGPTKAFRAIRWISPEGRAVSKPCLDADVDSFDQAYPVHPAHKCLQTTRSAFKQPLVPHSRQQPTNFRHPVFKQQGTHVWAHVKTRRPHKPPRFKLTTDGQLGGKCSQGSP